MDYKSKKVLFAISSLGLGHATRTLPVINYFLKKGCKISILSYGNTLNFLNEEFKENPQIDFISFEDYPPLERGKEIFFYFYLLKDLINTKLIIKNEHERFHKIENKFDFIFSDGKYGIYSKKIPSFILSHQISFVMPKKLGLFKFLIDYLNYLSFKKFDYLFIPDFKNEKNNFTGKLAHTKILKNLNHRYIGLLSSYKKLNLREDIDYLFIISGYLLEHKKTFIKKLIEQAKTLKGRKVFVLGDNSNKNVREIKKFNIKIYPSVNKKLRNELLNRANIVISRTGYTTIMDLIELNKNAILFPTPNQTEQEYLSEYLRDNSSFVICKDQDNFNLKELVKKINKKFKIKQRPLNIQTKDSLKKIERHIKLYLKNNYFSIVVPAHNEEKYIRKTLNKLSKLNYPKNRYEIITVENSSSDKTYNILTKYKNKIKNLKIYQCKKGVSIARNYGLSKVNRNSNWTIFLDAKIFLNKDFLKNLNNYLNKHKSKKFVIGTTQILPQDDNSFYSKAWFKFYDIGHKITNTSYSIQIARTDIAKNIRYDKNLNFSEDLKFIKDAKKFGKFFFFKTKEVLMSTRRFKTDGYFTTFLKWNFQAILTYKFKKNKKYKVIR